MTLDEWKPISKALFSAFPQANIAAETVAVYFADLAEFDARDVDAACTWLRQNTGPFAPSIAVIRDHCMVERMARLEHERIPDMTGIASLPEAEREKKLEEGMRASLGVRADPVQDVLADRLAEAKQIGDAT